MLILAYIGNGKSTNRYHLPYVLIRPEFRVKRIFERRLKKDWDRIDGVDYVDDKEIIYEDPEIDLVVITTPPATHYDLAKEALERGKHVLLEKPFTQSLDQAEDLFTLAKEKGLFIQAYQNRRFDSDFLTVQKVIESGKLGQVQEVEMHFDYFRPQVPLETPKYQRMDSFVYGHACHTLDQVISYFGKPKSYTYDVKQLLGPGRMNDYFDIDLFYQSPLKVSVKSSYFRIKPRPSFVVYGDRGCFIKASKDKQETDLKHFYLPGPDHPDFGIDQVEDYGQVTYLDGQGCYHEEKVVSQVGDYGRLYDGVYASLVEGEEKLVKDQETLAQIAMLEAVTQDLS